MPFPHKLIYVGDGWGICDHLPCLLWSWLCFKNVIVNGNLSVISITKQHYTLPRIWHVSGKIKKKLAGRGHMSVSVNPEISVRSCGWIFFTSAHVEQNDNKTSCRLSLVLTCHVLYFNGTYLKDYGSKFKHGFQISSDLPLVKIIVVDKTWEFVRSNVIIHVILSYSEGVWHWPMLLVFIMCYRKLELKIVLYIYNYRFISRDMWNYSWPILSESLPIFCFHHPLLNISIIRNT